MGKDLWRIPDVGVVTLFPAGGIRLKNIGYDLVITHVEARALGRALMQAADRCEGVIHVGRRSRG